MAPPIEASLPFNPSKHDIFISQGFDGPYSHNRFSVRTCQYDLRYALDFALPVGATVLAARQGIVHWIIQGNGRCYTGIDPEQGRKAVASSITLAHPEIGEGDDWIYSHYQHLDPESFLVDDGDQVEEGQPLAKTGLSGWVGDLPHLHLHFQYSENVPKKGPVVTSVPFSLKGVHADLTDAGCVRRLMEDAREAAQKIVAIRRRDGFLE